MGHAQQCCHAEGYPSGNQNFVHDLVDITMVEAPLNLISNKGPICDYPWASTLTVVLCGFKKDRSLSRCER